MEIQLVRHGESRANLGPGHADHLAPQDFGDHLIPLTEDGKDQARRRGTAIGAEYIRNALVFRSPYTRTRETLDCILEGAGVAPSEIRIFEDPRLREMEHGFEGDWDTVKEQKKSLREIHGWFFYRYRTGESPADCYDRVSTFLESMMRQMDRKQNQNVLIVSHGLTIRCFVMRFLHLAYEQFDTMANPKNCDVIRLAAANSIDRPVFTSGNWGVEGLKLRTQDGAD